ncbi:hypothetical protein DYB28_008905 [Aphanomyces astaci]|uniref:Secreted protein n=1 Tax=Aphanomyces astaci TaxID=112090 RepID=A0A397EWL6_APHAT|nr:hypothetical protein DYB30_000285 [Aphanomyces astaci]RHY76375.1 hypothetical protein DYB38_013982 [Aphanomyces astaci]RHZ07280.1 hypothetical protein DYB31_001108 [Aphanomyces astaci]RLO06604.1 hypothetical protein DYB28_008905 [Aphanomyces astaci]
MKSVAFFAAAFITAASATSLEKCGAAVTGVLTAAATNTGSVECHKETGISASATTASDEDVTKAAASMACNTWWDGIVTDINAIDPACKFPQFGGSGRTVHTDKFRMKYKEFLHVSQQVMKKQAGNGTGSSAATPVTLEQCGVSVSTILTLAVSNSGAKACSTETGIPLDATSISDETLAKALKAKSCKKWWGKIVTDIKAVKPACDFNSLDGSGTPVHTATFDLKYDEFLELGKKLAAAKSTAKTSAKKDASKTVTTKAATTAAAPTTTAAPVKSSAVMASLSVTAITMVAVFV